MKSILFKKTYFIDSHWNYLIPGGAKVGESLAFAKKNPDFVAKSFNFFLAVKFQIIGSILAFSLASA